MKPTGINSVHLVGGRGSAKTASGIIKLVRTGYVAMPGVPGFWAEPRDRDIDRVFMRAWRENVPGEGKHWEYKKGDRQLILRTGGHPTIVDLVSRNVDDPNKKANVGGNYGWGFIDEAAIKFNMQRFNDLKATIRLKKRIDGTPLPYRFLDTLSTPQKNGYYTLCTRSDQQVIHARSYDNPFIDKESIDDYANEMSEDYYRQEIEGQWVTMGGRIWSNFLEKDWPDGNLHNARWNPSKRWYLGMDIGSALGHWQIWQYYEGVAVVVAEGLQHNTPIQGVLDVIDEHYVKSSDKYPVTIGIGHDVKTGGISGPAAGNILNQWGFRNWQYPADDLALKSIQHQVLSGLIHDKMGRRRYCISKHIQRHGPEKELWGILNTMQNAQYPEAGSRDYFVKDKKTAGISNTEDPQDSALYLATVMHPPHYGFTNERAA
jgi:hypothetical protein